MKNTKFKILQNTKFEYKIGIIYLIIGLLWIFLSDTIFDILFDDKQTLTLIHLSKGFLYVIITSLLLFSLVKRHIDRLQKSELLAKQKSDEIEVQNVEYKQINVQLQKANEQIEESKEIFKSFVNNSSDMTTLTDENDILIFISPQCENIFGLNGEKYIGKLLPINFHPDDKEKFKYKWLGLKSKTEALSDYEYRIIDINGNIKWLSHAAKHVTVDDKLLGIQSTIRDITERKLTEEELRNTKLNLELSLEASKIGIWSHSLIEDPEHIKDVSVRNLKHDQIFGYKDKVALWGQEKMLEHVIAEDRPTTKAAFDDIIKTGTLNFECRILWPDQSIHWISCRGKVFRDSAGQPCQLSGTVMDITERKQAEEKIKKSEAQLANALDIAKLGPWEYDVPSNTFTFNDHFYTIFRTTVEREGGYTMTSSEYARRFVHPDDMILVGIETQKAIETTDPNFNRKLEHRIIYADGEIGYINVHFYIIKDAQGRTVKTYGVNQDITEQKLDQETLKISENSLAEAERLGKTGSWNYIVATDTATWSANMFRIFDVDPEMPNELVFKYFVENLVHPGDRDYVLSVFADAIRGKQPYDLQYRTVNKDGSIILVHAIAETIYDAQGKVVRLVGRVEDITERKLLDDVQSFLLTCGYPGSNENFFESLAKYLSKVLNSEYVCIDKLEGDGLTAQTVAIFNEGKFDPNVSYTLKQTPCGDVVGKSICCFPENVCQLFPNDEALQELKAQSYIGTTLWSFDGKPIGLIAIIGQKPISNSTFAENVLKLVAVRAAGELERNKAEDDLIIAKQKAEEADRLKSAFLANMSHEIRTPMNGILGFASLLSEPGLSGEEQQEYIKIIEKSGARMLNIINDIIDISKIEAGLMKADIKIVNIYEKIEYIYTFFKPEVEAKGMNLIFSNSVPTKEAIIKTDVEKLYAILANLVKNAIKYSNEGTIELGYCKIDNHLEIYVKDTGIGIPKNKQEVIFERFIQADISDMQARQGAGLGLSITKAYVEMLGGKIWVESEEGVGSIFYFTLPCNAEPKEKEVVGIDVPLTKEDNQIENLKILIAEDDETSEKLILINIKDFAKEVLKVRTGIEAVEVSRTNPEIDLILMDIQMPDMGGYEATRQIRQFNKNVVIIAQTAYGLSGDREKAIEAGCNDYISKPINRVEFLSLIQKYFKK
ncbi:MAG: PAS domain-containing protein [bacterium]